MTKLAGHIDGLLQRVEKVTQDTAENLRRELRLIEEEKQRLFVHLDQAADRIRRTLHQLGGESRGRRVRRSARLAKSKRVRRDADQLKRDADAVFNFIRSKGKQGVKGGEIRNHYPKIGQNIPLFVRKFGGHKIRTTGAKAATRYFAQ
jgi:hypothetical protein